MKKLDKTPVAVWERELISLGLKPIFEIIQSLEFYQNREVTPHINPAFWPVDIERDLIQEHLKQGCNLLNFQMVKVKAA
jgi:hypothetical protein